MHPLVKYIESKLLAEYQSQEARELAFIVAEELTNSTRTELILSQQKDLLTACKDKQIIANAEKITNRLLKQEPWQYVFQHTYWCGMKLKLTTSTLIPRPETAELVQWISKVHNNSACGGALRVLDIGTGSGCIAIALKKVNPAWQVSACDINEDCLSVAKENALKNNAEISFFKHDILSDRLKEEYDIIVSNPPYITLSEKKDMLQRVTEYEPYQALFVPDECPLLFYEKIAQLHAATHLYFEINSAFGQQTCNMLRQMNYENVTLRKDINNNDRFVYGLSCKSR